MTDYADVPDVHALHQQREIVTNAINMIDTGGTLASMLISPGPPPPDQPPNPMTMMAVNVTTPPPTPANVLVSIRAWLVERQAALDQQMADLGVTNPPTRATQGRS